MIVHTLMLMVLLLMLKKKSGLFFGKKTRQMLNLWGRTYGIGVQPSTLYFRTQVYFAWYKNGKHEDDNDNQPNAGGGIKLMELSSDGLRLNRQTITRRTRQSSRLQATHPTTESCSP